MIFFDIDGTEYTAQIVTAKEYDELRMRNPERAGVDFTAPDGTQMIVLAPKAAA